MKRLPLCFLVVLPLIFFVLKLKGLIFQECGGIDGLLCVPIIPLVALIAAKIEKIKIPFKSSSKCYSLMAFGAGTLIAGLSFAIGVYIKPVQVQHIVDLKTACINFVGFYVVFGLMLFLGTLTQEICWRGYLWEKWAKHSWKGAFFVCLLWNLWVLNPSSTKCEGAPLSITILHNIALMPILHFLRRESRSIMPGTLFCTSIYAMSVYLQTLFKFNYANYLFSLEHSCFFVLITVAYLFFVKKKALIATN